MFEYRARVTRVIDGDTLELEIDLGLAVTVNTKIRLYGIDTWEKRHRDPIHRERGLAAKAFVEGEMERCKSEVLVRTHKDRTGKYGRYLANVEYMNGASKCGLADELRKRGFEKDLSYVSAEI